jgi:YesN/AraC family two-component response regulator
MEEIIETILLESEKSTFLLDLIRFDDQKLYVQILQTIHSSEKLSIQQRIKINPKVLIEIIAVLESFRNRIEHPESIETLDRNSSRRNLNYKVISENEIQEIQKRYLKGISLKDLALQFDCSLFFIEYMLRKRGIEFIENDMPKTFVKRKFRYRRRR